MPVDQLINPHDIGVFNPEWITALSTLGLLLLAVCGFQDWRRQAIGRRKIALAEELLTEVYQVRRIFKFARSPEDAWIEHAIKEEPGEDRQSARCRTAIYWPIEQLTSEQANEIFGRLAVNRIRYAACFGHECDRAITTPGEIQSEVTNAALNLIRIYRDVPLRIPPEKQTWKQITGLHPGPNNDLVQSKLDIAIAKIVEICTPYLSEWLSK